MLETQTLAGLIAETPLHAGAGQSLGGIDLPIQREAPTGWPCVYGSAVKGAFRAWAHDIDLDGLDQIFGPDAEKSLSMNGKQPAHAGALLFSDAKLLLLPIRSLTTHFKWVTSPALLQRLRRDARRYGHDALAQLDAPQSWPKRGEAIVHEEDEKPQDLYLEEYRFKCRPIDLGGLCEKLAGFTEREGFADLLRQQLAIVSDDDFTYLSRYATPVAPHIRMNYDTKTVQEGALWYEESLPPDSVLYFALKAQGSRKPAASQTGSPAPLAADKVLSGFAAILKKSRSGYIQLGGNETVGMGWCQVTFLKNLAAQK